MCKARIRSRTFCASCGHPLCQTCTCPVPDGATEIHREFLANRGAHLAIRDGEAYTSYPGSLPSSSSIGSAPSIVGQRSKKTGSKTTRSPIAVQGRASSVRDNPFVIADRITKAHTAAAQATPVSVIANRKLSEYVPHHADYTWQPEVSSESECNDPTCRATHEGYRPYRHSVGCIAYKEAHGKRPSEFTEHMSPNAGEAAHHLQCPNTLESTPNMSDQQSEASYSTQHVKDHLAAAARWHAAHDKHTPRHDFTPDSDVLDEHGAVELPEGQPHSLPGPPENPNETKQLHGEDTTRAEMSRKLSPVPADSAAGLDGKTTPPFRPQSKVDAPHSRQNGPRLIRARSPTSWLRKPETSIGDRGRLHAHNEKGSNFLSRRIGQSEERLDFTALRSRLKHHDRNKPATRPGPYVTDPQRMSSNTACQQQEKTPSDRIPDQVSEESPTSHTQQTENSSYSKVIIVAPEPQRYQIYYALSASLESSSEVTDNEEFSDSREDEFSSSNSSRRRSSHQQNQRLGGRPTEEDTQRGESSSGEVLLNSASRSSRLHLNISVPIESRPLTS